MPMSPLPNWAVSLLPPLIAVEAVVLVPLALPQEARRAAVAAEPPVSAMNLRRETGSLTARATALWAGAPAFSRSLLSGMIRLLAGFLLLPLPYAAPGPAGSQSARAVARTTPLIQTARVPVWVGMGVTQPKKGHATRPRV